MKYYTDGELIEMVENYGETSLDSHWLANRIRERFAQRQNRIDSLQTRINVAAQYMGHNLISELEAEEY